jgi:hypothetical protein
MIETYILGLLLGGLLVHVHLKPRLKRKRAERFHDYRRNKNTI